MPDRTGIQWTDSTWNPVRGCTMAKGSETGGCLNCYACAIAARDLPSNRSPSTGKPFARRTKNGPRWTGDVELITHLLDKPLRWRKPRRVFVNSTSDLFHERLPFEHVAAVFSVMALAQQHTFQVLTKRPERAMEFFRWVEAEGARLGKADGEWDGTNVCTHHALELLRENERFCRALRAVGDDAPADWPLANVWLGTSVENQATADERIPQLLRTPAAVRFISAEPLLGILDIKKYLAPAMRVSWGDTSLPPAERRHRTPAPTAKDVQALNALGRAAHEMHGGRFLDWVIVGGESGPAARPCDVAWVRSIQDQCRDAGVACFVKQLGKWVIDESWKIGEPDFFTAHRWLWPGGRVWVPGIVGARNYERPEGAIAFGLADSHGGNPDEWPHDLRVREFPASPAAVAA